MIHVHVCVGTEFNLDIPDFDPNAPIPEPQPGKLLDEYVTCMNDVHKSCTCMK